MFNAQFKDPSRLDAATDMADPISLLRLHLNCPIVLVGLMGAGKSTVGRALADMLQLPFTDADEAIEEAAQLSISEIFERHGETYFRDGERRVIARLMSDNAGVIATGGGAFCDSTTRELILAKAITIWLDCDLPTLVKRTGRRANRPLLKSGDPKVILDQLYRERAPMYALAPIRIEASGGGHAQIAEDIVKAIAKWL